MNKYELIDRVDNPKFGTMYRLKALKSFGRVNKGDLGGYVSSSENLSQEGTGWIFKDARALDNSRVLGDTNIFGDAIVSGDIEILSDDDCFISENVGLGSFTLAFYNTDKGIIVNMWDFTGTLDEFKDIKDFEGVPVSIKEELQKYMNIALLKFMKK